MTSPETLELEAVDAALAGRYVGPEHAELAELALLLRDDRPQPTPAWATRLDRRVETGFPARPKERKGRVWLRTFAPALGVTATVVLLIVAAGSLPQGGDDSGESAGAGSTAAPEQATDSAGGGAGSAGDAAVQEARGSAGSDGRANRKQQRSASLTLVVGRREVDSAANRIGKVTADLGGFVAGSSILSTGGGDMQLRIPSNQLDTAIQRLSDIGRVREVARNTVDITSSVVSARDRLRVGRAERKALLTQLATATTVNETESIRARLDIVSREIATARRRLARVNNQASFADLSVTLTARGAAEDDEGAWTPGDAWRDALRVLEVAAGVAVIAAAVLLPLTILWLLVWLARLGLTRRGRERALDMA